VCLQTGRCSMVHCTKVVQQHPECALRHPCYSQRRRKQNALLLTDFLCSLVCCGGAGYQGGAAHQNVHSAAAREGLLPGTAPGRQSSLGERPSRAHRPGAHAPGGGHHRGWTNHRLPRRGPSSKPSPCPLCEPCTPALPLLGPLGGPTSCLVRVCPAPCARPARAVHVPSAPVPP